MYFQRICPCKHLNTDFNFLRYSILLFSRCAGAGHLRDDILYYSKQLKKFPDVDDEKQAYLMDMGIKALRLFFVFQEFSHGYILANWVFFFFN